MHRTAIALVALIGGSLAAAAATAQDGPCLTTFKGTGRIWTGIVYTAHDDFDLAPEQALANLQRQLATKLNVEAVDAARGTLSGTSPGIGPRPYPFQFSTRTAPGNRTRVTMTLNMPPGAWAQPATKQWMCDLIAEAVADDGGGAAPAAAASGAAAASSAPPAEPPAYEPPEPALTNEEIVKLTQAGIAAAIIVTKIQQAANESFDLSTDALIALRKSKVANAVVAAMQQRVGQRGKPAGH